MISSSSSIRTVVLVFSSIRGLIVVDSVLINGFGFEVTVGSVMSSNNNSVVEEVDGTLCLVGTGGLRMGGLKVEVNGPN